MGRIGRVQENIGNRVNMDLGGGFTNECDRVQPSGEDSRPLPNDNGYTYQWGGSGRWVVGGYFDYDNKIAKPGEKRIYGRDADGNVTSHVYLQNDGTIESKNDKWTVTYNPDGSMTETNGAYTKTVATDGTVNINGFIINPNGSVVSPVAVSAPSMIADGKELAGHKHSQGNDSAGNIEQDTGENM